MPLLRSIDKGQAMSEIGSDDELEYFEAWWCAEGQYCRAGGGQYEKTFAYRAWQASKLFDREQPTAWCIDAAMYGLGNPGEHIITRSKLQREDWIAKGWKVEPMHIKEA